MEDVSVILAELSDVLMRYGYEGHARRVASLVNGQADDEFWEALSGLEFWGGAGAIWEVEPFDASHPDAQTSKSDYRHFAERLAAVAELVNARRPHPRAIENAELVVKWSTRR